MSTKIIYDFSSNVERARPYGPKECNLNLDNAMHRFLTFPQDLKFKKEALANEGFYATKRCILKCHFCRVEIFSDASMYKDNSNIHKLFDIKCDEIRKKIYNISINNASNYRYECNRLYSFLSCERIYHESPLLLARQGFFKNPKGNIECYVCRLGLSDVDNVDDISILHKNLSPLCAFMLNKDVGNVIIGKENSIDSIIYDCADDIASININFKQNI